MSFWLVVAIVAGAVLIGLVAVGIRRPRHAEDLLASPKSRRARTDTPGTLDQATFRALLESIKVGRETGWLRLWTGEQTCSPYFLFGHLFHATSDTHTGEAAFRDCLGWHELHYTFDKEPKLPMDETIERPMDEILAE
jgi:Domain of unknown function (DUF4388)